MDDCEADACADGFSGQFGLWAVKQLEDLLHLLLWDSRAEISYGNLDLVVAGKSAGDFDPLFLGISRKLDGVVNQVDDY